MMHEDLRTPRRPSKLLPRDAPASDDVLFLDDLTSLLRVSRATIERRRREGTTRIPELDPIDRRPRWSRHAVAQYLASGARPVRRTRGRPRRGAD